MINLERVIEISKEGACIHPEGILQLVTMIKERDEKIAEYKDALWRLLNNASWAYSFAKGSLEDLAPIEMAKDAEDEEELDFDEDPRNGSSFAREE